MASGLMADIPNCNSIARWNSTSQGYQQYISFIPITNFGVRVGYPYYVNVSENGTWPGQSGLKKAMNENAQLEKNCAPHLIYGTIKIDDNTIREIDLNIKAYQLSVPDETLTQKSAGSMIKDGYWVLQCHSFPSGWKAGETIHVELTDKEGAHLDDVDVVLSNNPADEAEDMIIKNNSGNQFLFQNSPNPFSDFTIIQYQLKEDEFIEVNILSLNGEVIRTLVNGFKTASKYEVVWNGCDDHGNKLSAGIYLYILKSKEGIEVKKATIYK
jgi:hypothetical protein